MPMISLRNFWNSLSSNGLFTSWTIDTGAMTLLNLISQIEIMNVQCSCYTLTRALLAVLFKQNSTLVAGCPGK